MAARKKKAALPPSVWHRIPSMWQKAIVVAAGVGVIAGAVTALPKAVEVADPIIPATRGHVGERLDSRVKPLDERTSILMYWKLDDQKNTAKKDEGGWSIQLQREQDPVARTQIQKQIERAQSDHKKYDSRLQQLKVPEWVK